MTTLSPSPTITDAELKKWHGTVAYAVREQRSYTGLNRGGDYGAVVVQHIIANAKKTLKIALPNLDHPHYNSDKFANILTHFITDHGTLTVLMDEQTYAQGTNKTLAIVKDFGDFYPYNEKIQLYTAQHLPISNQGEIPMVLGDDEMYAFHFDQGPQQYGFHSKHDNFKLNAIFQSALWSATQQNLVTHPKHLEKMKQLDERYKPRPLLERTRDNLKLWAGFLS